MPHVNRQVAGATGFRRRPGRLVNDEAINRHRARGQPDYVEAQIKLAGYLRTHAVEQATDVWHYDPPLLVGTRASQSVTCMRTPSASAAAALTAKSAAHDSEPAC